MIPNWRSGYDDGGMGDQPYPIFNKSVLIGSDVDGADFAGHVLSGDRPGPGFDQGGASLRTTGASGDCAGSFASAIAPAWGLFWAIDPAGVGLCAWRGLCDWQSQLPVQCPIAPTPLRRQPLRALCRLSLL